MAASGFSTSPMSSPASAIEQGVQARLSELLIGGSLELMPREMHRAAQIAALLPKEWIARFVAILIIVVGGVVLANQRLRGLGHVRAENDVPTGRVAGIGLVAGFSSGVSGAGWGPLGVTSLILARIDPRQAVGSSLLARVFMAVSAVGAFLIAQAAFHNVTPNWWIVVPLFFGSIAPMIPAALLLSRLGRERAIVGITLLSVALALPSLLWGH